FDDFREAFIAQSRSMHPKAGLKSIVAWIVFLLVLAGMAMLLRMGAKQAAAAPAAPVIKRHATGLDIALRIIVPLVPWVLIGFLIWHFVFRSLRAPRRSRPVEQYIDSKAPPY